MVPPVVPTLGTVALVSDTILWLDSMEEQRGDINITGAMGQRITTAAFEIHGRDEGTNTRGASTFISCV